MQRRAAAVGFDWPDLDGPLAKVREELAEIEAELARVGRPAPETEPDPRVFAELGDLLFTVVNVARVVNVDPELALRATSKRFVARVELAESLAPARGRPGPISTSTRRRRGTSAPRQQLDGAG